MRFLHFSSFRIQLGLWYNIEGFPVVISTKMCQAVKISYGPIIPENFFHEPETPSGMLET